MTAIQQVDERVQSRAYELRAMLLFWGCFFLSNALPLSAVPEV
jgi:hypothetical protein